MWQCGSRLDQVTRVREHEDARDASTDCLHVWATRFDHIRYTNSIARVRGTRCWIARHQHSKYIYKNTTPGDVSVLPSTRPGPFVQWRSWRELRRIVEAIKVVEADEGSFVKYIFKDDDVCAKDKARMKKTPKIPEKPGKPPKNILNSVTVWSEPLMSDCSGHDLDMSWLTRGMNGPRSPQGNWTISRQVDKRLPHFVWNPVVVEAFRQLSIPIHCWGCHVDKNTTNLSGLATPVLTENRLGAIRGTGLTGQKTLLSIHACQATDVCEGRRNFDYSACFRLSAGSRTLCYFRIKDTGIRWLEFGSRYQYAVSPFCGSWLLCFTLLFRAVC